MTPPPVYRSRDGMAVHPDLLPEGPFGFCPACESRDIGRCYVPTRGDAVLWCVCFNCRGQWRSQEPPLSHEILVALVRVARQEGGVVLKDVSRDWLGIIAVWPDHLQRLGGYVIMYTTSDRVQEEMVITSFAAADEQLGCGAFREALDSHIYTALRDGAHRVILRPMAALPIEPTQEAEHDLR